jgi:hypothetical protein
MVSRRSVTCLATIGFLSLGMIGCGGGPSTGESLKQLPPSEVAARQKSMAEGYKAKMQQKGQAKVTKPEP